MKSKKAVMLWISWILLLAFVVTLSVFMYDWMTNYTTRTTTQITEHVYDTGECESVSVHTVSLCQNLTSKKLQLQVQNTNVLKIDQLIFRMYDYYDNPLAIQKNITIRPQQTENVNVFLQSPVQNFELIPAVIKGKKLHVCENKAVVIDSIAEC
ncbi:hypothetical protein GOV04_00015 [Candidatus Woesearchaeota archaeon]|nr:hypothetical protein [Candidatus Woesearchaeota archaeon]